MFPPAGAGPVKVTLCVAPEISQVTVVPGAVVTVAGLKVSFGVATVGPAAVPGAVTVRVAVTAPAPSTVAVTSVVPTARAVTNPVASTVATVWSAIEKLGAGRSGMAVPLASFPLTVS
jgi:hypothetical protein